jgi:hypothetical protein
MRRATPALLIALAVLAAACGSDTGEPTTTTVAPSTTTTQPATTTIAPTTTTTVPATTTTIPATTTTTLAGEPIDFGPATGDLLMVVGVAHNDVLNLRASPGATQPISDRIPPTFTMLIAQGNTRDLSPGFWIEVDYEGTRGWVNMRYVAYEGVVTDETSTVVSELGERPVEPTMSDLGELVASVFASEADPESAVVQVTPVSTGDLVEVTFDVVGIGDDSVLGFRLHVFAEEVSGGFSLRSVEVTTLCGRGVTEDGLCV